MPCPVSHQMCEGWATSPHVNRCLLELAKTLLQNDSYQFVWEGFDLEVNTGPSGGTGTLEYAMRVPPVLSLKQLGYKTNVREGFCTARNAYMSSGVVVDECNAWAIFEVLTPQY